jgi:hypothetical protein
MQSYQDIKREGMRLLLGKEQGLGLTICVFTRDTSPHVPQLANRFQEGTVPSCETART